MAAVIRFLLEFKCHYNICIFELLQDHKLIKVLRSVIVVDILAGIGIGFFSSTQYTLTSEVTLAKWRAVNINVPSFHIHIGLFALVAWAVRDWRNIHLITGLIAVPFIATWW